MRNLSCLIVDDEPIACDIIQQYCNHLDSLDVIGVCKNAFEAKFALEKKPVDIIFLDIHMPLLDGLSLIKTLKQPPQVIFTTAFTNYAVEAFALSACDYLLKPFSLERFMIAVDKAIENLRVIENTTTVPKENSINYCLVKSDGKVYKINYDDILYAEAKGNYTRVITADKKILASLSFGSFEKLLSKDYFLRIHRSYIVNLSKVDSWEGNIVHIRNVKLPIGGTYKEHFLKHLGL